MFHEEGKMFHARAKYSTERVKCSPQVLNILRIGSNVPHGCEIFHGQCQLFHGGAKYSTDNAKCSTEVLNIPRTMPNVPRRC